MFGRILSIDIIDSEGNSVYLVDPKQDTRLMCSGTIEYLPSSSGSPRATIQIYNLPQVLSANIFTPNKQIETPSGDIEDIPNDKIIRISFGYKDENDGALSDIFVGKIVRAFTTREDATTTITKIYAYQLGDVFTSAISSAQFDEGTTIYNCVKGLFDSASVKFDYQIPSALRGYKIDSDISFYGKTINSANSLLNKIDYMTVVTPLGLNIVPMTPDVDLLDCVVLGDYDETGKVVARSGLIGFPCLDSEGMRFETLINPLITLYSYVWMPNSIIIDERDGFTPSNQFGATYDPAGIYRVVKLTTTFDSHTGACKTSYIALAAGTVSKYFK